MNDFRFALRQLRRRPGFTLATVLTLALGIGATTAVFTVVNAMLFRPLPVADPGRLYSFVELREDGRPRFSYSLPEYLAYRDEAAPVLALAAQHLSDITLSFAEETVVDLGLEVSGNYFEVLGIRPAAGRFFGEEEARSPGQPVAVISHDLWERRFRASPEAIGATIRVNSHPLTIIGVAPRGFHGTMLGARPPLWYPLGLQEQLAPGRDLETWGRSSFLFPIARPGPGLSRDAAEAALAVAARRFALTHEYASGRAPEGALLRPFTGLPPSVHDAVAGFLWLLLATAGLVLLIAAVNTTGMFLARASARRREVAVRLAVGGARSRVSRELVAECVVIALLAGAGSILVAVWAGGALSTIRIPGAGAFSLDPGLDARVITFAAGVSVLTGLLCGVAPALHLTRRDLFGALREGDRGGTGRSRLRSGLVVTQIALSTVLLIGAGLFVRTLRSALATDYGFQPDGVVAFEMNLRISGHDDARGRAFQTDLLERLGGVPGVTTAALATVIPLGFGWDQTSVRVPGHEPAAGEAGFTVGFNRVSIEYFQTLRMPLLAGRGFLEEDREGPPVIVVNETFARRFWPDGSAVDRVITYSGRETRIVGVVPDSRYQSVSEPPTLFAYLPFHRGYSSTFWLHVRTDQAPVAAIAAVRREIRELHPDVAPVVAASLESLMGGSLFPQRIAAALIGVFGLLGLALSAMGVFGVLSFQVGQRTREIGVRVALGASRRTVLGLVFANGLRLLLIGTVVGALGAVAATRLLAGLLHGLSPTDPPTYAAVAGLLAGVVVLASWLPARRAARTDPMEALRYE